ncbi:MAG TPA: ATP-binding protein [Gaiellaceae bacterium]|nr:ATP-binding protein [Gaiellaceae bacterium]
MDHSYSPVPVAVRSRRPRRASDWWLLMLGTGAAAVIVTVLVAVLPFLRFAYRGHSLHVALETAAALIALVAAFLVFGRFRQSARLHDLALVCALVLLGLTNLVLALPPDDALAVWTQVIGALLGATVLTYASFAPERRLARPERAAVAALSGCCGAIALVAISGATVLRDLPAALPAGFGPEHASGPQLVGHPVLLATQIVSVLLFAAAAIGFTRRGEQWDDGLRRWFGVAATLAAAARLNYFLFPSLYSEWVYTGDIFRLGFYLVVLVAAAHEIRSYWHSLADNAVLEERRRMARDLHDGLAQELAFIASEARSLNRGDAVALRQIATAAERALDESRRAIAALTRPVDEPLGTALTQASEEVGLRVGAHVRCEVDEGIDLAAPTREALLRVVREAVTNAGRHGGANTVLVSLRRDEDLVLRIVDDGCGFEPADAPAHGGFGLVSMRERIQQLGGEFRLRSQHGIGTEIEVVLR